MSEDRQIRRLKLRELRILMAVIQAESMAKAARQLAISQPAVSRAIADMEHTLEVPLFDRTARGIEPTRYGRALFRRSVAVFDELKQGVQEIAYLSNPEAGELRIGSSASLSEGIVLAVVNRLSRKYPQVVFHVVPGGALALRESLRERRIELGIARLPEAAAEDEVHAEILFEEPLVVVASTANPWVRRRRIKLAELVNEPWTWSGPGTMFDTLVVDAFRVSGLEPPRATVYAEAINMRIRTRRDRTFSRSHSGIPVEIPCRACLDQEVAHRVADDAKVGRDHHAEEADPQPAGAAFHRMRP